MPRDLFHNDGTKMEFDSNPPYISYREISPVQRNLFITFTGLTLVSAALIYSFFTSQNYSDQTRQNNLPSETTETNRYLPK